MKLYEFTTLTDDEEKAVVRVSGRIADHPDPEQQKEYITFQFAVALSTEQRAALQRLKALEKAIELIDEVLKPIRQIAYR